MLRGAVSAAPERAAGAGRARARRRAGLAAAGAAAGGAAAAAALAAAAGRAQRERHVPRAAGGVPGRDAGPQAEPFPAPGEG